MAESSALHAFMGHANPTLCHLAARTGGAVAIGNVCDGDAISNFAVDHDINLAFVSSDDPLAAGVVDSLLDHGIRAVGPTRLGSEIEWNKEFCRSVIARISPESNPAFAVARTPDEARTAVHRIGANGPLAIKPVGLTGGKGVKVVGPHLADNEAALGYALEIIGSGRHGGAVLVEERICAPEFTIQAMTDGHSIVFPPATYDYPYRFAGDTGPGTGGMGSCALPGGLLPFLEKETFDEACDIIRGVISYLDESGREFSGCMNAGFFVTQDGLRVIECNARFGDPEGINIMALFDGDWMDVLGAMSTRSLSADLVPMSDKASLVTYLVAPEYALGTSDGHLFTVDEDAIAATGGSILFSSAIEESPGAYRTVGTSRAMAVTATAREIGEARSIAAKAIDAGITGDLEWRDDIGVFPART